MYRFYNTWYISTICGYAITGGDRVAQMIEMFVTSEGRLQADVSLSLVSPVQQFQIFTAMSYIRVFERRPVIITLPAQYDE